MSGEQAEHGVHAIREFLLTWLVDLLGVPRDSVDRWAPLHRYGLDSLKSTALVAALSEFLARPVPITFLWDHPTLEGLSVALARGRRVEESAGGTATRHRPENGAPPEPLALVGIGCRLPGAADPSAFWRLLVNRHDAIRPVPQRRRDLLGNADIDDTSFRWGGFLDDIDLFDPLFFGISPREARVMDPQQRLMLELAWEALEDAGIAPGNLAGTDTGVFVGTSWCDYSALAHEAAAQFEIGPHAATGMHDSIIANRVSYALALQGPSMAIDTACSSSLVAVHLACQSLWSGESELALAGGVTLNIFGPHYLAMNETGALSPDGRCKTFDARADGTVRGEGAAVVVVTPLRVALERGLPVYCLIRGSAVNNDGLSNGLTAPNPRAQETLLRTAYRRAGLAPWLVDYVECHGTGTPLGDPIEAKALGTVLGRDREPGNELRIGSVKTNIGHLEPAAGVAGLAKVALAMRNGILPASLHYSRPNPQVPFAEGHLRVQDATTTWHRRSDLRRAGISAFGFGGTNCHLVTEELAQPEAALLLLAADSTQELTNQVAALRSALAEDRVDLAAACRQALDTLGTGRFRLSAAARTTAELRAQLDAYAEGRPLPGLSTAETALRRPRVAFLCSGTGSQWFGMCRQLVAGMPAFRRSLVRAAERIERILGFSVLDRLFDDESHARLDDMEIVQPMLFCVQVALADAWRSLGVEPDLVIGQSVGEIAAAHLTGALSLDDAALVAATHARLVQRLAVGRGDSLVVAAVPEVVAGHLAAVEERPTLAGRLGPASTLVSGDTTAIRALTDRFAAAGIAAHRVRMGYASHSPLMDPVLTPLRSEINGIVARPAQLPMISTVTGKEVDGESLGPDYWPDNVRQESRLTAALDTMAAHDIDVVLELSPHPVLLKGVRASLDSEREGATRRPVMCLASLQRGTDEAWSLLASLGELHTVGQPVAAGSFLCAPRGRHTEPQAAIGPATARAEETPLSLLPVTAHSAEALRDTCRELSNHVERNAAPWLPDLAYTLATRRTPLPHRIAFVVRDRDDLLDGLAHISAGRSYPGAVKGTVAGGGARRVALVFSGGGTHWAGMGRALMDWHAGFRASMHECDAVFRELIGWSVVDELSLPAERSRLDATDIQQPVLFTLQVSLARLWMELGIEPEAFVGHSIGEVAAVCVAGGLSVRDAARVTIARSHLIQHRAAKAAMIAVQAGDEEIIPFLAPYGGRVAIAALNSPTSSAVSGPPEEIRALEVALNRAGISSRAVRVDRPGHSPGMDPLLSPLREALTNIEPRAFWARFHSTALDGAVDPVVNADYWAHNLRNQVRFAPTVAALADAGIDTFVEISPHGTLRGAIEEITQAQGASVVVADSIRRGEDDNRCFLNAAASLFVHGVPLSLETLFSSDAQVVETPLVSWQRHPYWLDAAPVRQPRTPAAASVAGPTTSFHNENATAPTAEATITGEIAHVLGMPVEELAEGTRLRDFGLDSMLAMRLGSRIQTLFGHRVSLFEFFTDRTVGELTARIAELVGARASTGGEDNAPPRLRNTAVADNLSDADAEELLAELTERGLLEPVSPEAPAAQPRDELRAALERTQSFALAPVAHGQAAIWFMQQLSLDGAAYNLMFGARVPDKIDESALRRAAAAVVERHPALRTVFVEAGGHPYQVIRADPGYEFDTVDGTGLDDAALTDLLAEHGHRPFDLDQGPLLRLVLVNRGAADNCLLLVIHHVAADAASVDIVVRDLREFYGEAQRGTLLTQAPETPYTEFVEWEREWLGSPAAEAALHWWSQQLAQPPAHLDLPRLSAPDATADKRPAKERDGVVSYAGEDASFRWDAADTRLLKDFAVRAGVSVSTLVMAGFVATLGRATGARDIVLGTAVAQRSDAGRESAVGYYLNTIPVRARPRPDITFDALLREVHDFALGMLEHMNYPLDLLVSALKPPRRQGRTPLFDIAVNWLSGDAFTYANTLFHGAGVAAWPAGPLPLVPLPLRRHIAKFDLEITMGDVADEVVGQVQFKPAFLERETVTTLLEYFHRVLLQAIDRPDVPLSDLVLETSVKQAVS